MQRILHHAQKSALASQKRTRQIGTGLSYVSLRYSLRYSPQMSYEANNITLKVALKKRIIPNLFISKSTIAHRFTIATTVNIRLHADPCSFRTCRQSTILPIPALQGLSECVLSESDFCFKTDNLFNSRLPHTFYVPGHGC